MAKYNYTTYSEIPENTALFLIDLTNDEVITDISLVEINQTLNELDEWYTSNNQNLDDFLNG